MTGVVGVDPSISSTGVFEIGSSVRFDRIRSTPDETSLRTRLDRLRSMATRIHAAVTCGGAVDLIVIEGPAYGSNNAKTHELAGFWWLLVHVLEQVAPVAVAQPGTVKKFATGNGRAEKDEVLAAAIAAFPGVGIKSNDVADAASLAGLGATHLGIEFGGGFAPSGRASVQAVRWPVIEGKN